MNLTKDELNIIVDGILKLIRDASDAVRMVCGDDESKNAIIRYIDKLRIVNNKVCEYMKMEHPDESDT